MSCLSSKERAAYTLSNVPSGTRLSMFTSASPPENGPQTAVGNADERSNALFGSSRMIDLRAFVAALDWSDPEAAALLDAFAARFGPADDATLVIHGGAETEVAAAADALGA